MLPGRLFVWILFMTIVPTHVIAAAEYVSPETVPGVTTIDTAQAKAFFERGVVFIDVRSDADWAAGRIPGAVHLELEKVFTEASFGAVVRHDQEVVIYCNGTKCPRSSQAAASAVSWGFTRVYYYRLGFPDWQAADCPVE